ncbi:hypothetical protein BC829DRAFT_448647 [Chytridium lagenaria]|nr:hypothetical protein BC829DRAFT_448647 [Chytridium lagenaria]
MDKGIQEGRRKRNDIDSTLEFEKRRNIPVRYDRELMATTLKAMKRIQEIKAKRERVHTKKRLQGKKEKERADVLKLVQKNIELIKTPELRQKMYEKKLAATSKTKDVEMA